MESYTGTREIKLHSELIDQLYRERKIDASVEGRQFDKRLRFPNENEYVTISDSAGSSQSAIAKIQKDQLVLINQYDNVSKIVPRNKEQHMALDALLDDNIKIVVLTGRAGTGKTLLTLAASLHRAEDPGSAFRKIILTRPMSWVGKHGLGALPGDVSEKFSPYLENYMCNLEYMMGGNKKTAAAAVSQFNMEFIPIQLIRGASWANSFIIADEVQVLSYNEMVALGTRVGENSKIIIMGDLGQRDERIAKERTGIYKFVNSELSQKSPIVAVVDLVKCERSGVAALFADIFEV